MLFDVAGSCWMGVMLDHVGLGSCLHRLRSNVFQVGHTELFIEPGAEVTSKELYDLKHESPQKTLLLSSFLESIGRAVMRSANAGTLIAEAAKGTDSIQTKSMWTMKLYEVWQSEPGWNLPAIGVEDLGNAFKEFLIREHVSKVAFARVWHTGDSAVKSGAPESNWPTKYSTSVARTDVALFTDPDDYNASIGNLWEPTRESWDGIQATGFCLWLIWTWMVPFDLKVTIFWNRRWTTKH